MKKQNAHHNGNFGTFLRKVYFVFVCTLPVAGCSLLTRDAEDLAERKDYYFATYSRDERVKENSFITDEVSGAAIPPASAWTEKVPRAIWDGHEDAVAAFSNSWIMVGGKIKRPEKGTNFKKNYVYTPFGKSVFVWGSAFITMFGQYASNVFPFIEQLDNFYAAQTPDGFIPRQLGIYDGRSQFERNDPSSVGGNIFAWAELEWYRYSGDKTRLKKVYPVLLAYHEWIRKNRTWKDGTYFSSGWGCGMDNIPRMDTSKYSAEFHHGFISFADVTFQQIFDAKNLIRIAEIIGVEPDGALHEEVAALAEIANARMWDETSGLYHDLDRKGSRVGVSHIGGYWALLAGIVPPGRADRMVAGLFDPERFAAPSGTRSLARGERGYEPDGGNYWRGGVWCITDWAIVRGLDACGRKEDAHNLAKRHVLAVAKVFSETGTIWESYDPERLTHGKLYGSPVRRDFVGFSGVTPVSMLIRDVFGIDVSREGIVWNVRLKERHGIENLTLPDGNVVSLVCEKYDPARKGSRVRITSQRPVNVKVNEL